MGMRKGIILAGSHEDVDKYFEEKWPELQPQFIEDIIHNKEIAWKRRLAEDILDIVDKHFERSIDGNA